MFPDLPGKSLVCAGLVPEGGEEGASAAAPDTAFTQGSGLGVRRGRWWQGICLPPEALSKLSAPVTSRAEARETVLGRTGGNRKYCVTSLRTQFCSPSFSPGGIAGILVLAPLVVFRKCVNVSSPGCDRKGKGADSQSPLGKLK